MFGNVLSSHKRDLDTQRQTHENALERMQLEHEYVVEDLNRQLDTQRQTEEVALESMRLEHEDVVKDLNRLQRQTHEEALERMRLEHGDVVGDLTRELVTTQVKLKFKTEEIRGLQEAAADALHIEPATLELVKALVQGPEDAEAAPSTLNFIKWCISEVEETRDGTESRSDRS